MFWLFGQLVGVVIGLALVIGAIYGVIWLIAVIGNASDRSAARYASKKQASQSVPTLKVYQNGSWARWRPQ